MNKPLLGCIADDITGASDLANALTLGGMSTVQVIGVPDTLECQADAVVISLKSRSLDPKDAVEQSLAALEWLLEAGVEHFFFKYCSTFDSTQKGNIGPVITALSEQLGAEQVLACPGFPDNGRTVYQGHLFVGDRLISDSGMLNHPLTPMTDPDIIRWLSYQTQQNVELLSWAMLQRGTSSVEKQLAVQDCTSIWVCDVLSNNDLESLARVSKNHTLVTGGSAIARYIASEWVKDGRIYSVATERGYSTKKGPTAIISGSCSSMTRLQIKCFANHFPVLALDTNALMADADAVVSQMVEWMTVHLVNGPAMLKSSSSPEQVAEAQDRYGKEALAGCIEHALSEVASQLVESGVERMIVAGGETSGAVMSRLGVEALKIGPEIAPGVPWTESITKPKIVLALKSGNFGGENFFLDAIEMLDRQAPDSTTA